MQKESIAQEQLLRCIVDNTATVELISEAVHNGARLDAKNDNDDNFVHIAAQHGALVSLMAIIEYLKMKSVSARSDNNSSGWFTRWRLSKDPELSVAAFDLLIGINKQGLTPLHLAAALNHETCVRFLASKAATHTLTDSNQQTALILASSKGHLSSVIALENHAADLYFKGRSGAQAMHFAASSGSAGLVRFFLDKKVPVLSFDAKGRLPSCYAAKRGSVEVLDLLGANGDPLTGEQPFLKSLFLSGQESPLKHASKRGHIGAMRFLLEAKVSVKLDDRKGRQPLHDAAKANQPAAVDLLVEHGADFQRLTKEGQLPVALINDPEWKKRFWKRFGMKSSAEAYMYASLCYMSSFGHPQDKLDLTDKKEMKLFQDAEAYLAALGWQRWADCLSICAEHPLLLKAIEAHHYYGIIYYREIQGQIEIVVAHRGTDLSSTPNLVADGQILGGEIPKLFIEAALPFVRLFLSTVHSEAGVSFNNKQVKSIIHVGFSLGGFLAAAAMARTFSPITFAKTFDAPGIHHLSGPGSQRQKLLHEHIENFVATPNLVNTCHRHVGPVYHLSTVDVQDDQRLEHDVRFEVPSTVLIGHILETVLVHNLKEIIDNNQEGKELHFRAVRRWPQAKIELIYGPFPRDDSFQIGMLNAISRLGKTVIKKAVWDAMQRQTVDGKVVGLIAVKHRCNYTIEYICNGDVEAQRPLQLTL